MDKPTVTQIESEAEPMLVDITNVSSWFYADELGSKQTYELAPIGVVPFPNTHVLFSIQGLYWLVACRNMRDDDGTGFPNETIFEVFSIPSLQKATGRVKHFEVAKRLDEDGNVVDNRVGYRWTDDYGNYFSNFAKVLHETDETIDEHGFRGVVMDIIKISLLGISLMHCKNIDMVDKPISRQYSRLMKRKNKPVITYKTLNLEPFKRSVKRDVLGTGESEIKRALHICRGHFATYTAENPLFGKYTGTYWKPMHTRGSKAHGEVRKDYSIKVA